MEIVTKIAPLALALIMLALGLGLSTQDFLRVIKQPKDFIVGLICMCSLLPLLYLKGISTNDFQVAFEPILGSNANNLSPQVISRLKNYKHL